MTRPSRFLFFGNWGLGARTLSKMLAAGVPIAAVVTQHAPSSADPHFNAVHQLGIANGLPVYSDYRALPEEQFHQSIGLSVAFNRRFDADILNRVTIINAHPSRLPRYKGPSPIAWQIKNHDDNVGMTVHLVDRGLDTGGILAQDSFRLDYDEKYDAFIDRFNDAFSSFITSLATSYLEDPSRFPPLPNSPGSYQPRIGIPAPLTAQRLTAVAAYLNRPRIAVFTGNRADFGMLLPLLMEMSAPYALDLFVSGAHLLEPWRTVSEVRAEIADHALPVSILELPITSGPDYYLDACQQVFGAAKKHFAKHETANQYSAAVCLGDRVETMAFAQAAFFSRVPLIHIAGGDIANVPYFDTSLRHAISKMSHVHLVSNEASEKVLWQLGEEKWRVKNVGHLSFDYDRLGQLPSMESLREQYDIDGRTIVIVATFHPAQFVTEQVNLTHFEQLLTPLMELTACRVIVTYPNNDPGGALMMDCVRRLEQKRPPHVRVVPNLGTPTLLGIMKYFQTIVAGNSSSGLIETARYNTPALNIGDRQTDRTRGENVRDVAQDPEEIRRALRAALDAFQSGAHRVEATQLVFGDGTAALRATRHIGECLTRGRQLLTEKRFDRLL